MIDCLSLGCEFGATTLSIEALCILTLNIALKSDTLGIMTPSVLDVKCRLC